MLEKEKIIDKINKKKEEHKEFFKKKYGEEKWFDYWCGMKQTIEYLYESLQWQYERMLESGMTVDEVFDLEDFKKDILKKKIKEMKDVVKNIEKKIKELNLNGLFEE